MKNSINILLPLDPEGSLLRDGEDVGVAHHPQQREQHHAARQHRRVELHAPANSSDYL